MDVNGLFEDADQPTGRMSDVPELILSIRRVGLLDPFTAEIL